MPAWRDVGGLQVEPLDSRLDWGAVVRAFDIAALRDPALRQSLYDLWVRAGVLVFRGAYGVDEQLALSRAFGPLRRHPSPETRSATSAELIDVHFEPKAGQLNLVAGALRGQSLPWHSDLIYVDKVNRGGVLRPVTLPSHGGETGFIDKIDAHRRLPETLKGRIEGLHVVYQYDLDIGHLRFGPDRGGQVVRYSAMAAQVQSRAARYPRVIHPLVFAQPETGQKVLNLSPWFALGIHEMPNAEGDALLEALAQHLTDPAHAYFHPWRLDEMLLFDNWRMLHSAPGSPVSEVRHLQRTTIGGDYGLGRLEPDAGQEDVPLQYVHV